MNVAGEGLQTGPSTEQQGSKSDGGGGGDTPSATPAAKLCVCHHPYFWQRINVFA
eukprot:m.113255 g.113255  ORF g.113255 m.113255 type:complete len:55 (-) comp16231_c0_seq2:17-181(-)